MGKVKEIIDEIKKHFFPQLEGELVNLVKCEDVLSPQVCTKMREIAAKLKIKVSEIDRIIRELVAKKITEAKEIIKHLKEKLIELRPTSNALMFYPKTCVTKYMLLLRKSRSLPKKLKRSSRKSSSISSLITEERSENVTR